MIAPGADAVSLWHVESGKGGPAGWAHHDSRRERPARVVEATNTRGRGPKCYGVRLMGFVPDRAGFLDLARRGRLAFVYREVLADTDTPVSAYAKLGRGPYSFLLESVVGGDKWAAYSFAGVRPRAVVRARGIVGRGPAARRRRRLSRRRARRRPHEPLRFLDDYLAKLTPAVPPGLPRFFGGAVGWLGYDIVRSFERLPEHEARRPRPARALLRHHRHGRRVRQPARHRQGRRVGRRRRRRRSRAAPTTTPAQRIEAVLDRLARPAPPLRPLDPALAAAAVAPNATVTREAFEAGVRRIQEYILAGDAFQVVYSQRFQVPRGDVDPFDVYRALRVINPSPYMFTSSFPRRWSPGASPEVLVRLDGGEIEVRPIAGTRRRGAHRRGGRRAGGRAAHRSEGAGRAHDADRPRPQRRRARVGARARSG